MTTAFRTLGCVLALALAAAGQQPAKQTFEAADVHTSTSTSDDFGFLANGRVEVRGVTMLRLIASAYNVPSARITGGPSWLDTDRFDITAKAASASASQQAMKNMLQT